jgi:hypothetical protein
MSGEQLLIFAVFLLVGIFNFIVRLLRERQRRRRAPADAEAETSELPELSLPPGTRVRVPSPPAELPPQPVAAPRPAPPPAPAVPVTERRLLRMRLGSRTDLRRAIVLMTVLGPCRAHDLDQRRGAREEPIGRA